MTVRTQFVEALFNVNTQKLAETEMHKTVLRLPCKQSRQKEEKERLREEYKRDAKACKVGFWSDILHNLNLPCNKLACHLIQCFTPALLRVEKRVRLVWKELLFMNAYPGNLNTPKTNRKRYDFT